MKFDENIVYTPETAEQTIQQIWQEYNKDITDKILTPIHNAKTEEERTILRKSCYNKLGQIKKECNWKKLNDEIIPITDVAKYTKAINIQFTGISNISYDGILSYANGTEQYVECTTSIDYQREDLQQQILEEHGYSYDCPGCNNNDLKNSIGYSGNKSKHTTQNEPEIGDFEAGFARTSEIQQDWKFIQQKIDKGNCNNQYQGFWLILTTKPFIPNNAIKNQKIFQPAIIQYQNTILKQWNDCTTNPFTRLIILVSSGNFNDYEILLDSQRS